MYKKFIKRLLDFSLALLTMPFFLILLALLAPLIYFEDKGPVFYNAQRRGMKGKVYKMYKFRSMKVNAPDLRNADGSTFNSANDSRVTKIGRFIRKTSIDELPQLLNVLKGDMSFVGPRPTLVGQKKFEELDELRQERCSARPGITGYSQAYFRNSISAEEKVDNDVYYARNLSFKLDAKIFFKTIIAVLKRENIFVE